MKTLDLIVPCYNEEAALPLFYETVTETLRTLSGYQTTLIFVDDGSSDRTLETLKRFARSDSRVTYLSFSRNFGKESAMLAGLRASTADIVGFLDADLQHSPSLLPDMLQSLEDGYDVAAAKRVDRAGETKLKSRLSDAFYQIANRMTDVEIDPGAQDFRVMKRVVADALLSLGEHRRFTKGLFSFVGFRTKWFPHENAVRAAGETKWNFKKLFVYACDGILAFSDLPLKLPLYLGGGLCAGAGLYALIALIIFLCGKAVSPVHAVLIVMLFLCGLILFAVGVLGLYLARIYTETKGRPVYIVKETNLKK